MKQQTPLRKRSKSPLAKLKAEAWRVFSLWIRKRDNYTCYTCGKRNDISPSSIHAGHFISRRHNATMFNEMNVHAQCLFCNMWDYGNSGTYAQNLIRDYGKEKFDELVRLGRTVHQFTAKGLEALIERYSLGDK